MPPHAWVRALAEQIETRQRQQAERRLYAAGLQSLINHHQRELDNLQTQLAHYRARMVPACDNAKPSSSDAQSVAATSAPPPGRP